MQVDGCWLWMDNSISSSSGGEQKRNSDGLYFREHPIVTLMIVLFDCASPESNQGYHGHNVRY